MGRGAVKDTWDRIGRNAGVATVELAAPPYRQVVEHLREQILRGELADGVKLPSARALADEWGISEPTAYKALASLRSIGLVETRTGVGTTVRPLAPGWTGSEDVDTFMAPHERHEYMRRTERIRMPGEESTVLRSELVDAPVDVQRALELDDGDAAICRERVVHAAGSAVELCTSWFSGALATPCPRLLNAERIPDGTTHYVERRLGVTAVRLDETDVATLSTDRDAELLGIAPSTPIIMTQVTIRTADGPLGFEVYRYPGPRVHSYALSPP